MPSRIGSGEGKGVMVTYGLEEISNRRRMGSKHHPAQPMFTTHVVIISTVGVDFDKFGLESAV